MKAIALLPIRAITLLPGLLAAALVLSAQEKGAGPPPVQNTAGHGLVLGVQRVADADRLLLKSGEEVRGTILHDRFDLRTAYGALLFDLEQVAGLDFAGNELFLESLVTQSHDRFSGFLHDSVFEVQLADGARLAVRKDKIAKVVFRLRAAGMLPEARSNLIRLRNGDLFAARLLADPFPLITAKGPVTVPLANLRSVAFDPGPSPLVTIQLCNGDALQGSLVADSFEVRLPQGTTVHLHRDQIDRIEQRADGNAGGGGAKPAQPAAAEAASVQSSEQARFLDRDDLVWIAAGEYLLGSPVEERERDLDEGPETRVVLTQPFWLGKREVTQAEYKAVMNTNPSHYIDDPKHPVEKVSWREAMDYCRKLTQLHAAAGQIPPNYAYRLPTEAEWEYACRAGTTTRFSHGRDDGYLQLDEYAWFSGNSSSTTHPVGTKKPNPWGLYDMHGNVLEWCLDSWKGDYPGGTVTNAVPSVPSAEGWLHVARGGSWLYDAKFCRSANRDAYGTGNRCSDLGFRIVLAPVPDSTTTR
jgi:formylglycine-generating enzyme required for sulfatase activity